MFVWIVIVAGCFASRAGLEEFLLAADKALYETKGARDGTLAG
jgi:hypothetical protein